MSEKSNKKECKELILNIIIYATRLQTTAAFEDEYGHPIHTSRLYEIQNLLIEAIDVLEYSCKVTHSFDDRDHVDGIIHDLGNLDYDYSFELGRLIVKYFSEKLVSL